MLLDNYPSLSHESLRAVFAYIANHYAQKADKLMETIWQEKSYDEAKMLDILEQDLSKKTK